MYRVCRHDDGVKASASTSLSDAKRVILVGAILGTLLGLVLIGLGIYVYIRWRRYQRNHIAPSQQYGSARPSSSWFEEGRAQSRPTIPQITSTRTSTHTSSDLVPDLDGHRPPAPILRRPTYGSIRAFIARSARAATRSEAESTNTSAREPPVTAGRTFRVVNR